MSETDSESDAACTCNDPHIVRVIDRNMAPVYIPGNPYSRFCTNCGRRQFCAEYHWVESDERYVIPNGDETPIPVDDYDEENVFECPNCEFPQFGTPDSCEKCSKEYAWD